MKMLLVSVFAISVTMSASLAPTVAAIHRELAKVQAMVAERTKALQELLNGEGSWDQIPGEAPAPEKPKTGLHTSALQPSKGLRDNGGLKPVGVQSGARGITSEDEWRKMFPRKPGYSYP